METQADDSGVETGLDNQEALEFLTSLAAKVNKPDSKDAYVYGTVEVARVKLLLRDLEGSRKALDDAEKHLETFDSVESVVHASFYRVNADYYNVHDSTGNHVLSQELTNT